MCFLPVRQKMIIFFFGCKIAKNKAINAINTNPSNCLQHIDGNGVRQSAKCLVQTLNSEKNFFLKAEFKNFISEKEKNRKNENQKISRQGM